tara:strand:+ start:90 stop:653 length:564 start_codon:yes stop_codon:yes gene_type:complete
MSSPNSTHEQKSESAMVIYIPYTFGDNAGRSGVTEKQIFWHMRNLNVGRIDHIDCLPGTDKNGINIKSWFVHLSTWTASDDITSALNNGGHLEVTYDDYGHYWKLFKYTPKNKNKEKTDVKFKLVPITNSVLLNRRQKTTNAENPENTEYSLENFPLMEEEETMLDAEHDKFEEMIEENRVGHVMEL